MPHFGIPGAGKTPGAQFAILYVTTEPRVESSHLGLVDNPCMISCVLSMNCNGAQGLLQCTVLQDMIILLEQDS